MKYVRPALITILGVLLFVSKNYSQTRHHQSIISNKMVVLAFKHNDSSYLQDHTDTLNIPVVSDKYPGLKKALAFENIGDPDGLDSVKANYAACACGLFDMAYTVLFETKDVLSISIYTEWMGAYPSSRTAGYTLNVHNGEAYPLGNEINAAGRKWIYETYKKLVKQRIADDFKSRKDEDDEHDLAELNESIDSLGSDELFKSYLFTPRGIKFSTAGVLPHAVQAHEPDREWFVPYARLRKYKMPHAIVIK